MCLLKVSKVVNKAYEYYSNLKSKIRLSVIFFLDNNNDNLIIIIHNTRNIKNILTQTLIHNLCSISKNCQTFYFFFKLEFQKLY